MAEISEKPVVVMVDDERDFLDVVRRWAEPDYDFIGLTSGAGLSEELEGLDPSLLVLDVNLPGLDGFELCRRVRAERRFDGLPILFLTGSRDDEDFLRNMEAGGTAFLSKPVARKPLLSLFRELIGEETTPVETGTAD